MQSSIIQTQSRPALPGWHASCPGTGRGKWPAQAKKSNVEALLHRDRRAIQPDWDDADDRASKEWGTSGIGEQSLRTPVPTVEPVRTSEAIKGPRTSREAINAGLEAYQASRFDDAIAHFNRALELPGTGAYRISGTVREVSCASDGEQEAALYNMACAYAQLRQTDAALTCLEAVLESGFQDIKGMRSDPDLAPIRGMALDALLRSYDNILAKAFKQKPQNNELEPRKLPAFWKPW